MRVAKILKYASYGVIVFGAYVSFKFLGQGSIKVLGVFFASVLIWCFLRVVANIGQIIYNIQGDLSRALGNLERSSYRINSSLNEIKDLIQCAESKKDQ